MLCLMSASARTEENLSTLRLTFRYDGRGEERSDEWGGGKVS